MNYARKWHLAEILGTEHLLLRSSAPGIPLIVFDVSNEGNVNEAFVAVVRALEKLPRDAVNLDRAHAVLDALGILYEADSHRWTRRDAFGRTDEWANGMSMPVSVSPFDVCDKCGISRSAAERFGWVQCSNAVPELRRAG